MTVLDAQGACFFIDNSGGTPQEIGQVNSFSGFDGEAADIDITVLKSTAKEFRQGLQDNGNFSIEVQFDPNDVGQDECDIARAAQATRDFRLLLASGDEANFEIYVKSFSKTGAVDGTVTGTVNMKITGDVVWS